MQCNIIYLKPRSSYRPAMRSDTLWGAICWGMKMLYGEKLSDKELEEEKLSGEELDKKTLEDFIKSYTTVEPVRASKPIYISSAFPYLEKGGKKELYLPRPLLRLKQEEFVTGDTFQETIQQSRTKKNSNPSPLMTLSEFKAGDWEPTETNTKQVRPKVSVDPMTHNTINRLTGSTLSRDGRGQLFHTEERRVYPVWPKSEEEKGNEKAGLYFLAQGDMDTLEAILRLLQHYGIGGDRSSGKGRFDITLAKEPISIPEPNDANAQVSLSLYHPKQSELQQYENEPSTSPLQYKTIVRQGWKAASLKKPTLYFEEGSVFPLVDGQQPNRLGKNAYGGKHEAGHHITQYGFGFMINVKVPTS